MTATMIITPPPWMRDPDLIMLMNTLNQGDMNARLVGGCVRNHLMGFGIKDIDIATTLTPDDVMERLKTNHIKAIPTGIKYGTVTAVINHNHYEITTLRGDHNTDGRHADVVFSEDWNQDAARRDFTMNALYADIDGSIYDPLGTGIDDIQNKTVRFIGNPEERITEDFLRILRFFRFYARYNDGDIHDKSFAACKKLKDGIDKLSNERIADELYKIFGNENAPKALSSMCDAGLFNLKKNDIESFSKLIIYQNQLDAIDVNTRFYQSNIDQKYIQNNAVLKNFKSLNTFKESWDNNIKHALYRFERSIVLQGLLSLKAEGENVTDMMISDAMNTSTPQLPVTAKDIMDHLKIDEGRAVGENLKRAEDIWIESDFKMKRLDILKKL